MVTGSEHVRQCQQRDHGLIGMPRARHGHQRPVGQRDAHALALATIAVHREEPAGRARAGDPVPAVRAGAVAERERRNHEIALRDVPYRRADVLDDADELVTDRPRLERRFAAVVPQVRPAHARQDHAHDRVGRLLDRRVRALGKGDRAGLVEHSSAHLCASSTTRNLIHRYSRKHRIGESESPC
jgi:hypothetical protein